MTQYRFPNIQKDIANAKIQKQLLKNKEKSIFDFHNDSNITVGGLFDVRAFNKRLDKTFSNILQRQKLKDKISKLKAKSKIPNQNSMTLNQFISGLYLDTYDMFYELFNSERFTTNNINNIMDKNYRRITLYFLLLIVLILVYYIISIKSYLFSDVRNN